jgi:hypothetical protein
MMPADNPATPVGMIPADMMMGYMGGAASVADMMMGYLGVCAAQSYDGGWGAASVAALRCFLVHFLDFLVCFWARLGSPYLAK